MPPLSPSPNAYGYPLLIKHLLAGSQLASASEEIVSGGQIAAELRGLGQTRAPTCQFFKGQRDT